MAFNVQLIQIQKFNGQGLKNTRDESLNGLFVDVTATETVASLRQRFLRLALSLNINDFDAAALKTAHPRELTQRVASHLYAIKEPSTDENVCGVKFASRHGDELKLWAIFEKDGDTGFSRCLSQTQRGMVNVQDKELIRAIHTHGLQFES